MALFSSKTQVGLYVDSETVSVLSGQVSGSTISVVSFAELRALNTFEGSAEAKQRTLDNIKIALNQAKVSARSVRVAVPGDGSMTRHFELPILPKKEERSAVRFEAQKYVPFDIKELYYDYETYPDPERKRTQVVFFACKKQWVDALSALLQLAEIKISHVELVSNSVARAFHRRATKSANEVSLVIAANDEKTAELVLQQRGSVLTTRHLSLAYQPNTTSLDVPMFISDVRLSIDYFSENFKNLKVTRLYLATPFIAETQTVCDALRKELSLPVDTGSVFQPPSTAVSTTAAIAVYGLTLAALEKRDVHRVNLAAADTAAMTTLSWEDEKKYLQDLAVKAIIGMTIFFAAVYFMLMSAANSKVEQSRRAMAAYPPTSTAAISDSPEQLREKESALIQKTAFFTTLLDKRVYLTTKMNELAKLIPANVQLSEWVYADEVNGRGASDISMKIDGYVLSAGGNDLSIVNKLVAAMEANKDFMLGVGEIRILSTQKTKLSSLSATKFTLGLLKKKEAA